MKVQNVFALMLSVVLLLLAVGAGLAYGPQPTESSEAVDLSADLAANFPWVNIEVDTPGSVGQYTSVAIDPSSGKTYISYYDATKEALRMAVNVGSGGNCGPNNDWYCQYVDSLGNVGMYSSIAVNPLTGGIGIAYYDATNGKLKYAYCASTPACSSWSRYTVDKGIFPVSFAGLYTSLKFAPNGRPIIAYYFDNPSGVDALKMAYHMFEGEQGNCGYDGAVVNQEWQCDTIQTGEGVGQYASLALDGTGHVHIAYYDAANGDLWYATSRNGTNCGPNGNTWLCYPVDSINDVGQYASLYVDKPYNHFHIAYYDATIDALKYAVDVDSDGNCGVGGSAQCDEIDSMWTGSHPMGVSMAEFYAGYPIIAYQSQAGSLNVARPAAVMPGKILNCGPGLSTWYCETIDRHNPYIPYRQGDFVSIAVDPDGLATVAYFGFITLTDGNLNVSYQRFHQIYLPLVMKD